MSRILIVEDNELNLKLFTDLLEAHGHETHSTRDGTKAVQMVHDVLPSLILMDIQLPEISGLEITRQIKSDAQLKHIPIIAVTAFAMKDDEEKILASGCEGYISKPISIAPFLQKIQSFLDDHSSNILPINPATQAAPSTAEVTE